MLILYLQSAVPTAGAVDFLWHSNECIYEDRSIFTNIKVVGNDEAITSEIA